MDQQVENKLEEETEVKSSEEVITFTDRRGNFDMTLIVEGRNIPLAKAVLCIASPVFAAMFEGDFKEKQEKELELHGKKYKDFVEFLSCLYPDKLKYVTKENVYKILPLVHEYQVDILQQRCEKLVFQILIESYVGKPAEIYQHLQLSIMYDLDTVRDRCIFLASELTTKQIKEGLSVYKPTDQHVMQIQEKALKRHELDADDIKDVVEKHSQWVTQKNVNTACKSYVTNRISTARNCSELLQAIRLCHKYPENVQYRDTLFSRLHKIALEQLKEHQEEFDLLPELMKQAWEKYCSTMSKT